MLIFRRVADVGKDSFYPNDSSKVSSNALSEFDEVSQQLIREYGLPSHVFISPYSVARESVKNINDDIIIIDPEIGRLQIETDELLNPKTLDNNPVFDTSIDDFKYRIANRVRRLIQIGSRKVIWVVTHTDVIRQFITLQKIEKIPRDITVDCVISAKCMLSRMSTTQKPIINDVVSSNQCPKCNRNNCICDAISATLRNVCMGCGQVPCMCIPKSSTCNRCRQINCRCQRY